MTKILVEHSFHHPFNPEKVTGGTERYCYQLFSLLKQRGLDVKLAVPHDTDDRFVNDDVIRLSRTSKQYATDNGKGATSHRLWWAELDELSKDFDLVITNSELSSRSFVQYHRLPKKQIHINHFAFLCQGSQMGFRYLLMSQWVRQNGGRVLSSGEIPMLSANETWESKKEVIEKAYGDIIEKLEHFSPPLHDGVLDVNILPHDLQPLKKGGKRVVVVGRPETGKRISLSAKVLVELANHGYDCDLFITPHGKEYEKVLETVANTSVNLHVGVSHNKIMAALASAGFLLFSSRDETNGLVAFEGATSGCKVFYSIPEPKHFLQPANAGIFFDDKSPKKIAQLIVDTEYPSDEERQRQRDWYEKNYSMESVTDRILAWV